MGQASRAAAGSAGRPCATLRSTFHARAGAVPGDWPRLRWDRARHRSAVAVDRDAGSRRRGLVGPRARSRPPTHHRIAGPRLRLRGGPQRVPILGGRTSPPNGLGGFYGRDFFHDYTPGYLYVLWLGRDVVGKALRRRRRPDQDPADPRRPRGRLAGLVDGPRARRAERSRCSARPSSSSTRCPGSTASSGARSTRSASSSCCSACASCGATSPERAAIFTVIAALIKPQLGILIPIVAVVTIRRALWPPTAAAADRPRRADGRTAASIGSGRGSATPAGRSGSSRPALAGSLTVVLSASRSGCRSSAGRARRSSSPASSSRSSRPAAATRTSP